MTTHYSPESLTDSASFRERADVPAPARAREAQDRVERTADLALRAAALRSERDDLRAEVERLQEAEASAIDAHDVLEGRLRDSMADADRLLAERDDLRAEVERLRATVARVEAEKAAILGQVTHAATLLRLSGNALAASTMEAQVLRWPSFVDAVLAGGVAAATRGGREP